MRESRQSALFSTSRYNPDHRKAGFLVELQGNQLAQGRDAAKEALKNDRALYDEIEAAVKAKLDEDKE